MHNPLAKTVHRLLSPLSICLGSECGCQRMSLPSPTLQNNKRQYNSRATLSLQPFPHPITIGLGNLDVTSLSYSNNLFLSSVYPWSNFIGKANEVSGKGLRKIKIVLASEWKSKPCQGYFQTIFPLAGHSRELSHNDGILKNNAIATRADHRSSPWGPGSQGRHGPGPTTKPTSWLRHRLYPHIPAPSHPDSLTL